VEAKEPAAPAGPRAGVQWKGAASRSARRRGATPRTCRERCGERPCAPTSRPDRGRPALRVEAIDARDGKTKSLVTALARSGSRRRRRCSSSASWPRSDARRAYVPWLTVETPLHVSVYQLHARPSRGVRARRPRGARGGAGPMKPRVPKAGHRVRGGLEELAPMTRTPRRDPDPAAMTEKSSSRRKS